jgi:hypothetical protein
MVLIMILISIIFAVFIIILFLLNAAAQAIDMDVKCTVYEHSDDENGNNVDVRILVMGLKVNNSYSAEVLPDHNPTLSVTTKSDYEGIFWVVAKILNGEKSTLFNVKVYEGTSANGRLVASGSDDAPCYGLKDGSLSNFKPILTSTS